MVCRWSSDLRFLRNYLLRIVLISAFLMIKSWWGLLPLSTLLWRFLGTWFLLYWLIILLRLNWLEIMYLAVCCLILLLLQVLCLLRARWIAESTTRILKGTFRSQAWNPRVSLSNWISLRRFSLIWLYWLFTVKNTKLFLQHLALSLPLGAFRLYLACFSLMILLHLINLLW